MAKVKTTISKPKPRTDILKLKSLGIHSYDSDNLYPQRCEDIENDSGTTKSCVELKTDYEAGSSFTDENLGSVVLNRKGLTTDDLRKKISESKNRHTGVIIHFNYNGLGQKTEINLIPFPYGRLTLDEGEFPNRVAVYNNWDGLNGKFEKKNIKYIHNYDRFKVFEQVNAEEVKTKDEDELETLSAKFDQYQGQVLYWTPNGNFGESLSQFQGDEGVARAMVVEKDSAEEPFEVIDVEIQKYDGLLQHTENSATEDIVRRFNVPDILVLRREGGLGGNGSELYEAEVYLNKTTQTGRDDISSIIKECFVGFVGNTGFEDYSIKPLRHEKPIEATDIAPIKEVVKDTDLSREQKTELLSMVYDLSEDRINKLLGAI